MVPHDIYIYYIYVCVCVCAHTHTHTHIYIIYIYHVGPLIHGTNDIYIIPQLSAYMSR